MAGVPADAQPDFIYRLGAAESMLWPTVLPKGSKEELLAQMHQPHGEHYGAELREADAAQAERVVAEELHRRGWREAELKLRRKADPEKVELAWRLRRETAMTLKWIAERLKTGVWTHMSNCLVQKRRQNEKCQESRPTLFDSFFAPTAGKHPGASVAKGSWRWLLRIKVLAGALPGRYPSTRQADTPI